MMINQSTQMTRVPAALFGTHNVLFARAAPKVWSRDDWLAACTIRLRQLHPDQSFLALATLAGAMFIDVAAFDPAIAAEMEFETWFAGDREDDPCAPAPNLQVHAR